MAINPPTSGNETFSAYKAKAMGVSVSTSSSISSTVSSSNQATSSSSSPTSTSKQGAGSRSVEDSAASRAIGVVILGWMMFGFSTSVL